MKIKKRWILFIAFMVTFTMCSIPELVHKNSGISESTGSVRNGKLKNGWLIPYKGDNFQYFNSLSYFIMDNAYVHSSVHATLMNAYKECETTCPGKEFYLMECTKKNGGRMLLHWTHQNGMSVDFMTPKIKGNASDVWANKIGLFHYLLSFDADGKLSLSQKTEIDFKTMAKHIIAIEKAAKQHGLRIRKMLFHTDLHDNLFASPSGRLLLEKDVNIVTHLSDLVNRFHDDHYHVDFEFAD